MLAEGKTVDDLSRVTGLTRAASEACFAAAGGSYAAALASFAQSYARLRDDDFVDGRAASRAHAAAINDVLRGYYARARALKAARALSDEAAWRALADEDAATHNAGRGDDGNSKKKDDKADAGSGSGAATTAAVATDKAAKAHEVWSKAFEYILPRPADGSGGAALQPPATTAASSTANKTAAASPFASVFSFGPAVTTTTTATTSTNNNNNKSDGKPSMASVFGFGTQPMSGGGAAAATATTTSTPAVTFGFGAALATTTATSKVSPATTTTTAAAPPSSSSSSSATTTRHHDAAAHATTPPPPRYCKATHFTGPYFDMPTFWQDEVVARAPLLNLDYGFLAAHKDALRPRLLRWVARASFYKGPVRYVAIDDEDEDVVRVIIKDAERTFFAPPHRAKLVALLHAMYHEFGAYGQAMSYLAALCMLALSEEETAAVLRFVATEYIKGHWAAEAVGFATSAWVVEYFLEKHVPDVAAHLQSLRLWPDTYLQKILTGLCVHVLRFRELFDFLDAFMQDGMRYLTRFCIAVAEHFRSDLLAVSSAQDASTVYDIMRLDARVADQHDIHAILDRVAAVDLGDEGDALDVIRSRMYSEKVEPRLQRAPKTEAFEPCERCGTARPTWWHDDTGAICTACKDACDDATLTFEKY